MCQAIPRPVLQVDGDRAEVMYDGIPIWVAVHGIPEVTVGEYLVVYAGQALERLPKDDAEEMLQFYADLERMVGEAIE